MLIDAHVYALPSRLRKTDARLYSAEAAVRSAIYLHPESPHALKLSTPDAILKSMDECGIDNSILVSFPWRTAELCRETNEFLLELSTTQNRFSCICSIQPADRRFVHEAEKCLENGALALKVNPMWQGFELDGAEMEGLCRFAEQVNVPLMVHVDHAYRKSAASPAHLYQLAQKHPQTRILAAHMGG